MKSSLWAVAIVASVILQTSGLVGQASQTSSSEALASVPNQAAPITFDGFVRVIDGDTIEVRLNGRRAGIGLLGIDAPQGNTTCGRAATNLLRTLVAGGVKLEDDPDPSLRHDARNRRLYRVTTLAGTPIEQELLSAGTARADGTGAERANLASVEGLARATRTGCLWGPASAGGRSQSLITGQPTVLHEIGAAPASTTLRTGFVQDIITTGLSIPTAIATLPDGRILIAEKAGLVRIFKNGALLTTSFIDIQDRVNDYWDHGLLGMAADPDFATNGFVYLLYTYENDATLYDGPKTARLARYTASGDTASPATEAVVLGSVVGASCQDFPAGSDCLPSDGPSHGMGAIEFAPDGTIFVTAGDAANFTVVDDLALRAQDLDSLAGKVLHITTTGAGVPTNPFWNGTAGANRSKVWAYGVRNSFRFDIDPTSGVPYLGDVGWDYREEIDAAVVGSNLGWPCYEGDARQSGFEPKATCQALYAQGPTAVRFALLEYDHCQLFCGSTSVTGGVFYTATAFPAQYRGAYFYGDYGQGFIRHLQADAAHQIVPGSIGTLATDADGPVDFELGGDGSIYYLAINTGELRRVRYVGAGTTFVSDLTWTSMTNGWGPVEKDRSNGEQGATDGQTITLNGTTFAKGLGTHAAADIRYALSGSCPTFTAQVGVDDEVAANGSVVFQVFGDAIKLYDSGVMTGATATKSVSVDLTGKTTLGLVVTNGGDNTNYDHGDWADAKLDCGGPPDPTGLYGAPTAYASGTNTHGVTLADVNGDGKRDLVAANAGTNNVGVRTGNGDGSFGALALFGVGFTPKMAGVADFNSDGKPDIVTANQDALSVSILIGDGAGGFGAATNYGTCSRPHDVGVGDFNGDGKRDLAVSCWATTLISVLLGNGDGTFGLAVDYAAGSNPHAVVVADFNSDGKEDLAVANHGSANVSVLLGQGNGTFVLSANYGAAVGPHSIRAADLNSDGRTDLVTVDDGSDVASVLLGNGDGTFAPSFQYATGRVPKGVAVGDVNSDGLLDLVTANTGGNYPTCCVAGGGGDTVSVLLGNGDGTFGAGAPYTVGTTAFNLALADLDGDSDLDLASANWHSNDIVILKNTTVGGADPDTTPPTVSSVFPAMGATVVTVATNVTATFSEGMDPATISTTTVTLAKSGTGVSATVSYDVPSKTATLNPAANLDASTTYTATVKGGASGAKDVAGNALATDKVWSFTTAAAGGSTTYLSDLTWTSMTNGWGPVEKDRSNGEQGATDGQTITLNGTTFAKGLGTHAAADIRYALSGSCPTFTAQVGVDDEVAANGSVVFQVFGDAIKLYDSGVMTGATATKSVSVDLTGKTTLGLVVTNGGDNTNYDHGDWADAKITCNNAPPVPTITQPASTFQYKVGDTISFSGSATDPEDGTIPATGLSWQVNLQHCPGTCHNHPFMNATGASGTFTAPDHGDNSHFDIVLTATDSGGRAASTTVTIQPQTVQLTLATSPTGLNVVYGGTTFVAPFTVTTIVGSRHTIYAPSPQGSRTFVSWSDGGAQQHDVTVPATAITYTATFGP